MHHFTLLRSAVLTTLFALTVLITTSGAAAQATPSPISGSAPANQPAVPTNLNPPTAPAEEPPSLPRRPNIIFIMADDMGRSDLSIYGQTAYTTPNLDRLAHEGMRFTHAYAGCTVCAPSRCVLMTGMHNGHASVRANPGGVPLLASDYTIAQALQSVGYVTGGFGKWGLGEVGTDGVPEKHGFDTFFGYYNQVHAHYQFPAFLYRNSQRVQFPGNVNYYGADPQTAHVSERDAIGPVSLTNPHTGQRAQYAHYVIFDEMLKFIRANKDKPFFCYAPWTPPHPMYQIPDEDPAWDKVKDKDWPMQTKIIAAMNLMIDRQVGEVMSLLKELAIDEKTIVFFTSDNGAGQRNEGTLNSAGNLRGQKTNLYEGGLRAPMIVRWPGFIDPGSISDHITSFVDITPTLADLAECGEVFPHHLDGLSLLPTLVGQTRMPNRRQAEHEFLYWEHGRYAKLTTGTEQLMQAVRMGNWKAVKNIGQPVELYDLSNDESESNNVADANPHVIEKITALMQSSHKVPPPQIEPAKPPGHKWR